MAEATTTPTLPPSWSPMSAGCLKTSDFWQWDYGSASDVRTVLGGPSQTTNCLPTSWSSDVAYSGSGCPPYYTSACQGNDSLSAVTCCPSLYSFECKTPEGPEYHGSQFRCWSAWATSGAVNVFHTNFVVNTLAFETQVAQTSLHLFALEFIYVTSTFEPSTSSTKGSDDLAVTSPQTTIPSPPATSTTELVSGNSSSSAGISTGAFAGNGVGAAAGVILLAVVAWWVYHRRKSRRQVSKFNTGHSPYTHPMAERELPDNRHTASKVVTPSHSELPSNAPAAQELPSIPH